MVLLADRPAFVLLFISMSIEKYSLSIGVIFVRGSRVKSKGFVIDIRIFRLVLWLLVALLAHRLVLVLWYDIYKMLLFIYVGLSSFFPFFFLLFDFDIYIRIYRILIVFQTSR